MSISLLETRIRDFINSGRRQAALLKNSAEWNKLCSALDVISDTQLAIESHSKFRNVETHGECYLIIYGTLQALLLQQDAAKHIGSALDIKIKLPERLEEIRLIRNSAVGHPTHQKENKLSKSSFINRSFMSSTTFQLMNVFSNDKECETHQISIPFLISIQNEYISKVLEQVINELDKQEMEHHKKYTSCKLVDIFPSTLTYHFGKISEATCDKYSLSGNASLQVISECLENFKSELDRRDEWEVYDTIDHYYELLEYPITRLCEYFNGDDSLNEKDAYIFAHFIAAHIKKLIFIAEELDQEYESNLQRQ